MKRALKIGAGIVAIHCALNLVYMMGMATPIAMELVKRNYHVVDEMSNLNRKNYKKHKWLAEDTDYMAEFMANALLAIAKQKRRVKHTTVN